MSVAIRTKYTVVSLHDRYFCIDRVRENTFIGTPASSLNSGCYAGLMRITISGPYDLLEQAKNIAVEQNAISRQLTSSKPRPTAPDAHLEMEYEDRYASDEA